MSIIVDARKRLYSDADEDIEKGCESIIEAAWDDPHHSNIVEVSLKCLQSHNSKIYRNLQIESNKRKKLNKEIHSDKIHPIEIFNQTNSSREVDPSSAEQVGFGSIYDIIDGNKISGISIHLLIDFYGVLERSLIYNNSIFPFFMF